MWRVTCGSCCGWRRSLFLPYRPAAYAHFAGDWKWFAILFLAPDLSFLGYVFGPRTGAIAYNAAHSTIGPLAIGVAACIAGNSPLLATALIWLAHVGMDRALGFGLKYSSAFSETHLGRIGRSPK